MSRYLLAAILALCVIFIIGCPSDDKSPSDNNEIKHSRIPVANIEFPQTEPVAPVSAKLASKEEIPAAVTDSNIPKSEPNKIEPNIAAVPKERPVVEELPKTDLPAVKAEPNTAVPVKDNPSATEPAANVSIQDKYAAILKVCVRENGNINYQILKRNKSQLRNLLDSLAKLDPNIYKNWTNDDKLAFWINTYNAQLLKIIADNYPIEASRILLVFWPPTDIRHIKGIWDNYKFLVMDEQFTLVEIEKRFLRGEFKEPKVFFAMSYASLSGPLFHNEPYQGKKLQEQLNSQISKFLSRPLGFRIDRSGEKVFLSAMFQPSWMGNEFLDKYGTDKKFKDKAPEVRAVLNFITDYIPQSDAAFLETGNYSVEYLTYDWRLNE